MGNPLLVNGGFCCFGVMLMFNDLQGIFKRRG